MIAVKAMRYAGQWLVPGDEFEPKSKRDARILLAIGKAADGEAPEADDKADEDKPTKRAYRRKDMKAED